MDPASTTMLQKWTLDNITVLCGFCVTCAVRAGTVMQYRQWHPHRGIRGRSTIRQEGLDL